MSLFQDALKQYAEECERAGAVAQQPSGMTDSEFTESLKLENTHGTLATFEFNGFDVKFVCFGDA